jgi:hypothetical protein
LRDRYVGANLAVYWIPGQYEEPWVGPDVLVTQPTTRREPRRVHRVWLQGPIAFVAEVASEKTRSQEPTKRETRYRVDLVVPEYLYIDLDRHILELWRLRDGEYHRVPEVEGRLQSQELGVSFGWDPEQEFVRIWTAAGEMLLTMEEGMVVRETLRRDAREEAVARRKAERARREAERRARSEAAERRAAQARIAELEAELERLRRATQLQGEPSSPDSAE